IINGELKAYANPDEPVTAEPDDELVEPIEDGLQEKINKLLAQGKTNEQICTQLGIYKLIEDSIKKAKAEAAAKAEWLTPELLEGGLSPVPSFDESFLPDAI